MHNKFVMERWINRPHIYVNGKKLQNLDVKKKTLITSNHTK